MKISANYYFIFLHITFWILIVAVIILPIPLQPGNIQLNTELIENFICLNSRLLAFYTLYFLPLHKLIINKKIVQFLLLFIFSMLLITCVVLALTPLLENLYNGKLLKFDFSYAAFVVNFTYYVIYGLFGFFFRASFEWYLAVNSKKELEKQHIESELSVLRAQVNPHFLFNTLNNIHSFIEVDPPVAGTYILKLSEIMRYMLYDSNTAIVPLDKEISYLKSYVELQRLRLSNPDYVQFKVEGLTSSVQIAPMLFIPIIENAFKHSTKKSPIHGINIKISYLENILLLDVSNSVLASISGTNNEPKGVGLNNLKRRLELLYSGKFTLISENDGVVHTVKLKIKI